MNTEEEIVEAFKDYRATEFGGWKWSDSGPVHPKEKGRYAQHGDGTTDIPPTK